jgi:hypothetical protein
LYSEPVHISAKLLGRSVFCVVIFEIRIGNISSSNSKSVVVSAVDLEVDGAEF